MSASVKRKSAKLAQDFVSGTDFDKLKLDYKIGDRGLLIRIMQLYRDGFLTKRDISRLLVSKVKFDFPKETESQLEVMLNCVNSDYENMFGLMLNSSLQSEHDLVNRVKNYVPDASVKAGSTADFIDLHLLPSGFVIKECYGKGLQYNFSYFRLTEEGGYLQLIEAYLLKYAVDNNILMLSLLGNSGKGNTAGPYRRVRILEFIQQGLNTLEKIRKASGFSYISIYSHLKKLAELGLVSYDTKKPAPQREFEWNNKRQLNEVLPSPAGPSLTNRIASMFYEKSKSDADTGVLNIKEVLNGLDKDYNKETILSVLRSLKRQGLISEVTKTYTKEPIKIQERANLILEPARRIRNLLATGYDHEMRENLIRFRNNRNLLSHYLSKILAEAYRQAPGSAENSHVKIDDKDILNFLSLYHGREGRGPTAAEVSKEFNNRYNLVWNHLKRLARHNVVQRQSDGSKPTYSLFHTSRPF